MSFTVPRADGHAARAALEPIVGELGIARVVTDEDMGKVSIVGAGMKSHPGVAAKVFTTLGERGHQHRDDLHLPDQDLVRHPRPSEVPQAVRALHTAFELGEGTIKSEDPFGQRAAT